MFFAKFISALACGLAPVQAALTYRGVDWSSVPVEEANGLEYKSANGAASSMENILVDSGVNIVRQRLWVNPKDKNYNLDFNLKLAKRAQDAGMKLFLDFHYSDTWADPLNQAIPSGWPTAIDDLAWALYNYTLEVSNEFHANGITPEIISIGNEITGGMLFPTGNMKSNPYNLARLLKSASSAVRKSNLGTAPKIAIHLDNGWKWETQKWWYDTVLEQGPLTLSDFDIIGVSYYPFYNSEATLDNLKSSLNNLSSTYKKGLIVAETDWPTSCPNPKFEFPADVSCPNPTVKPPNESCIPISVDGQTSWMKEVSAIIEGVSNGLGVFYWEPAWVNNPNLGSSCEYNCMFARDGTAMSSMAVFNSI
ncbi:Arabinogalactan endo-beta-1,4-galactanase [Ceratocystis fimbriata CBS 114723]|uniref:Arabinogalactan endo-beta-1,4-galactanase n=1 Tax=Ceratocystis fimbriata CBS 114723 TaxID=1035309 RepID=A0A2C5XCS0_9PEZI|nr:Arabinogalactan endo-beta-1,4-galactanase [Ceratocystis fimbriata CBS 114723]